MSEKLSDYLENFLDNNTFENFDIYAVARKVRVLESENQKLKDKADNWDTFYGQELHPNPVVQAECDRIENRELKDKLVEVEKDNDKMRRDLFELNNRDKAHNKLWVDANRKLAEVEKLIKICENEGTSIIYVYELKKALRVGDKAGEDE